MSEVINSSEVQENSVLAQNDTAAAEIAPIAEVEVAKVAAKSSSKKVEASATSIPVTNNSNKERASSSAASDANADDGAAEASTDKPAAEKTTAAVSPKTEAKKTPAKRTPSKRMSFIERAQKESEELVKNLGGSLELEGGRRTRSTTRGTPTRSSVIATPPPAKKARSSPAASGSKEATTSTPSRRGRGRKLDTSVEPEPDAEASDAKENKTEEEPPHVAADENNDSEKSSVENAENSVVDAANSAAAAEEAEETAKNAKKQEEEKSAAVSEKVVDKIDASLEPIPEEKQNNTDHELKETKEKEKGDEPSAATLKESVKEATTETQSKSIAKPTDIKKLPTPDPMEVDSSNSKDAGDAVELMDEDVTETVTESVVSEKEKGAPAEPAANSVTVNDLKSVAAPGINDASESGEPKATEVTQEHKKPERDFSEPKIASPQTDGTVSATPQHCN